jgi:hypothetical protein
MTVNNAAFYNAAIEGYVAGSLKGRALAATNTGIPPAIGTGDPSYVAITTEAPLWAAALDGAIPADVTGSPQPAGTVFTSAGAGVLAVPSTDATGETQFAQLAKTRIIAAIAQAAFSGRYDAQPAADFDVDDGTPEPISYTARATAAAALYQTLASAVTSAANANNLLLEYGVILGGVAAIFGGATSPAADSTTTEAFAFVGDLGLKTDALIAFDATLSISDVNGMPLSPTTSTIQQGQYAKLRLMESIVTAYLEGRNTFSLVAQNPGSELSPAITAWAEANAPVIANAYAGLLPGLLLAVPGSAKNPTLYNEAYCGFVAAALAARPFGFGPVSGDAPPAVLPSSDQSYVAIQLAATAFAFEVDAAVGASDVVGTTVPTGAGTTAITVAGTGALVPSTGVLQAGQLGKTGLMWGVCRAAQWGRPLLGNVADTTSATYSATAQAIVACYLNLCTSLSTV